MKLCANRCGHLFEPTRSWQRFCSQECRWQKWIADQIERRITRSSAVSGAIRRPSRNGKGTRIYVTPTDTDERILAKARAALERRA